MQRGMFKIATLRTAVPDSGAGAVSRPVTAPPERPSSTRASRPAPVEASSSRVHRRRPPSALSPSSAGSERADDLGLSGRQPRARRGRRARDGWRGDRLASYGGSRSGGGALRLARPGAMEVFPLGDGRRGPPASLPPVAGAANPRRPRAHAPRRETRRFTLLTTPTRPASCATSRSTSRRRAGALKSKKRRDDAGRWPFHGRTGSLSLAADRDPPPADRAAWAVAPHPLDGGALFAAAALAALLAWITARAPSTAGLREHRAGAPAQRAPPRGGLDLGRPRPSGERSVHRVGRTLLDAGVGDPAARVLLRATRWPAPAPSCTLPSTAPPASGSTPSTAPTRRARAAGLERVPADALAAPPRGSLAARSSTAPGVAVRYDALRRAGEPPALFVVGTLDPAWLTNIARELSRQQYGVDDPRPHRRPRRSPPRGRAGARASVAGATSSAPAPPLRGDAHDVNITQEYEGAEPMVARSSPSAAWAGSSPCAGPSARPTRPFRPRRSIVGGGALASVALAAALGPGLAGRTTRRSARS